MECTGAQILLESMKREGVDVLFGYPGGAVIDIYDELPRHPELHHVLVRHEQGAVHAADGYARASGKAGVCLVTSGPGATNTVTGIATAYADSIPLVVFTGQVPTQLIGNDAFQEVDIVGITRPCTKHNFLVKDVRKLAKTIRQAFFLARSGRPGPVLVDLPKDVMQARTEFVWPDAVSMRSYNPTYKPNLNQLRRTVEELAQAERPVILAGGGVIMANAAVCPDRSGPQTANPGHLHPSWGWAPFPATDPLAWHGGVCTAPTRPTWLSTMPMCIMRGRTLLTTASPANWHAFAPKARIVHIDIDPTSIRKKWKWKCLWWATVAWPWRALRNLRPNSQGRDWAGARRMAEAVAQWKESKPLGYQKTATSNLRKVIETPRSSPGARPSSPPKWASTRCGCPVLYHQAPHPAHQRRPGHHGLRLSGGGGGAVRPAHKRKSLLPWPATPRCR